MTKYMRSRHIPLKVNKPKALKEEIDDFLVESEESGSTLQALRESRGWSHAELGERVGLDGDYIALMETGERPMSPTFAKMFGEVFDTDYRILL